MGLLETIFGHFSSQTQERNDLCDYLIAMIDIALSDADALFSDPQAFVDPNAASVWHTKNGGLLQEAAPVNTQRLRRAIRYQELILKQSRLFAVSRSLPQRIIQHNDRVASMRIQAAYDLIGNVEGRKLDQQQMACIIKESHNHLVIAGAGTGKTTTIVGKIKYLLKSEKCRPEDILVLSFTNASATEMNMRIAAETGQQIAASTFHKLGLNIITQVEGRIPTITKVNLRKFIKEQLLQNMQNDAYLSMLSSYLLYNRVVGRSEFEFQSEEEYKEYLKLNPPTTVKNETVKSYGEMDIANFLMQNGIRYIYEHPYEIDTATDEYGQYHPDFYLPDHQIYIEYFGINRNGEVPAYFKPKNGVSAGEAYRASMEWKRATHREHHTTTIECYAYEKLEGTLLDGLKQKLEAASVILAPKSAKELWTEISAEGNSLLSGIIELFETLINLIKSNNYTIATVRSLNQNESTRQTNNTLLSLLEPIYHAYCQYLSSHKEIDFNDMINLASEYVRQGKYTNPYKHVIVDEYQDISKARFVLLQCLRQSSDYDLFCVGDDWQSIYRFAGSDTGFILHFDRYWGAADISRIETTYRFSQGLIDVSGTFVMQNPAQIKKQLKGREDDLGFPLGEICGYTDKYAIEFMSKKFGDLPQNSSVFLIGRYSFDANLLNDNELFSYQYNNVTGLVEVKSKARPDLNIVFLTAHKSKGLQADYVFIINNKNTRMGFPSRIQDAPIMELLLEDCEQYPHAEERRLFYVALTRAKKKAFIVTVNGQESVFAAELKARYENELKREQFECPLCGGQLRKRTGPYGEFWGCSNYHMTGCTYKRKIRTSKK